MVGCNYELFPTHNRRSAFKSLTTGLPLVSLTIQTRGNRMGEVVIPRCHSHTIILRNRFIIWQALDFTYQTFSRILAFKAYHYQNCSTSLYHSLNSPLQAHAFKAFVGFKHVQMLDFHQDDHDDSKALYIQHYYKIYLKLSFPKTGKL